jgi:hypothetical protein
MKHLADIPPDQRGDPWLTWFMDDLKRQADAYRRSLPAEARENAPLSRKALWTPPTRRIG